MLSPHFRHAFITTLPVLFGYVPLGIGFGILFVTELDFHWLFAPLIGLFVYAGAAQYLMLGLLANHASVLEIFIAVLVLNSRHVVYGISLLTRYHSTGWRKLYLVFGLTDETYSLLSKESVASDTQNKFELTVTALNQSYWVTGCLLGALIGNHLPFSTAGLEFALPALFMVLTIEQFKTGNTAIQMIIACILSLLILFFVSNTHMLIIAITASIAVLLIHYHKNTRHG